LVPDYIAASANVQAEGFFDAKKLSSKDKEALNAFLPEYLKTEAMSAIRAESFDPSGKLEGAVHGIRDRDRLFACREQNKPASGEQTL